MEILLIGGSGIISTEVCNLAIDKGHSVTLVNRGLRKKQINEQAKLKIADVRHDTIDSLKKMIRGSQYDVVIDFLSYNVEHLNKTLRVVNNNCYQYIFISSATVYKKSKSLPYTEESVSGNDLWSYAHNKALCEWYLREHSKEFISQYTIIRPYITYGLTRIPYQFTPLEYWSIVNRILCNKPIPIYGLETKCNLTFSKDFAVGALGLLLNNYAYGEAFHITSSEVVTWKNVIDIISEKLDKEVQLINIPAHVLSATRNGEGFDVNEILGDKGRNMIFDNSKIKRLVPEFTGETKFDEGISQSLEYYFKNKNEQRINYAWDGKIDQLIAKTINSDPNFNSHVLVRKSSRSRMSFIQKVTYLMNRYSFLYLPGKITLKIFKIGKKILGA